MKAHADRTIAALQIVGGAAGVAVTLAALVQLASQLPRDLPFLVNVTLGLGLFAFSVFAGVLLWRQESRGIMLSLIVQALQIIQFSAGGINYKFLTGVMIGPVFARAGGISNLTMTINFGGQFNLSYEPGQALFGVGIDLFALAFVTHLYRRWKQREATPVGGPANPPTGQLG